MNTLSLFISSVVSLGYPIR